MLVQCRIKRPTNLRRTPKLPMSFYISGTRTPSSGFLALVHRPNRSRIWAVKAGSRPRPSNDSARVQQSTHSEGCEGQNALDIRDNVTIPLTLWDTVSEWGGVKVVTVWPPSHFSSEGKEPVQIHVWPFGWLSPSVDCWQRSGFGMHDSG